MAEAQWLEHRTGSLGALHLVHNGMFLHQAPAWMASRSLAEVPPTAQPLMMTEVIWQQF